MKVLINRADPIGDDIRLEITDGIDRRNIRLNIQFDDGSGQWIVVSKSELMSALTMFSQRQS